MSTRRGECCRRAGLAEGDGGSSGGGPPAAQGIYTGPLVGSARTTCRGEASSGSSHSTICCLRHRHFGSRRLSARGLWAARSCAVRFSRVGLSAPTALLLTPPEPHRPPSRWRLPWGMWLTAQVPWLAMPGRARWGPTAPQPQPCGGWALPSPGAPGRRPGSPRARRCLLAGPATGGTFQKRRPGRGGGSWRGPRRLCACLPLSWGADGLSRAADWPGLVLRRAPVGAAWPQPASRSWRITARLVLGAVLSHCYIYPTIK